MADEDRAYVGYRSAGRRRPELNDRAAAADTPLALLRGAASGVLGAPGDIESLIRMLPGLSEQTVLPTSRDIERRLPLRSVSETPVGRAATELGTLGGGFYTGPGSPLRAIAGLPSAVSRAARDFALASGQSGAHVVKPKGGNWLAGTVERAVEPMRVTDQRMMEVLRNADPRFVDQAAVANMHAKDLAVDKWLETKLAKYIKNEMATPEDPIRALAERGVIHQEPWATGYNVERTRREAGFPEEGLAQSDLAKLWERRADTFVNQLRASDLTGHYPDVVEANPWLLKVPPETRVHELLGGSEQDLGFGHLADELRNAVNPESGLPAALRWKYQDLDKVTVPQAVQRVHDINAWRAANKAEADLLRARGPATHLFKDYPEQGMQWVELKLPDARPEGFETTSVEGMWTDPTGRLVKNPNMKALEEALKYEGEIMGHCVGGYCPDVASGSSRIFSLRDVKGQPHVTIDVRPVRPTVEQATKIAIDEGLPPKGMETLERVAQIMSDPAFGTQDIFQIKGSGKKDPGQRVRVKSAGFADEPDVHLLPFIQDFVRSGKWGDVRDLSNAGLVDIGEEAAKAGGQRFLTAPEFLEYERASRGAGYATGGLVQTDAMENPMNAYKFADGGQAGDAPAYSLGGLVQKYADGGTVRSTPDDPSLIDLLRGQQIGQNPQVAQGVDVAEAQLANMPGVSPEMIQQIIAELEKVMRDPSTYPEIRAKAIQAGIADEQDLPEQYDSTLIVSLLALFHQLLSRMQSRGFAQGGLVGDARSVAAAGRGGDTMLAHLSPGAAQTLSAMGGAGSVNPTTGLVEFKGGVGKLIAAVAPIALSIVAPGIGTAIGTALGASAALAPVIGSAVIGGVGSAITGGDPLKGALGGAIGGGLGGAVGSAANEAMNLGLGTAGAATLGGALTGAAQGAISGTGAGAGLIGGALGGYGGGLGGLGGSALQGAAGAISGGGDVGKGLLSGIAGYGGTELGGSLGGSLGLGESGTGALQGAIGSGARAGAMGGNVNQALVSGALGGSGIGKQLLGSLAEKYNVGKTDSGLALGPKEAYSYENVPGGISSDEASIYAAPAGSAVGIKGAAPYASMSGTYNVAIPEQVAKFANAAPAGSLEARYLNRPVFETIGNDNYVQRFINSAEGGGYLNPAWATYRPDVQVMASGQPPINMGEDRSVAYVPTNPQSYPGTKDTIMLVGTQNYAPDEAARIMGHELYHLKQPGKDVYEASPGFMKEFSQNIASTLPYLQEKYGYGGSYDPRSNAPLEERMADLQSFQFNKNVDFAQDPVFKAKVLSDPLAAAMWNASTVERTTRLDPRDLPPGKLTSSDFPRGQVPLYYQAQDAYRQFANPGRKVNYADGGLVGGADFHTGDFDPARIDSIVSDLHALNAG